MQSQDRCGNRQGAALVESKAFRVAFPQIEREGAAIGPEEQAPTSHGEPEPLRSEAKLFLVLREEGAGSQSRLRDRGCRRSRRRRAQDALASVSKHERPEPEAALQIAEHLIQRLSACQLVNDLLQHVQLRAGAI